MVVITASGKKRGLGAVALGELEAEDVVVEVERAVEVGDLEVDVADVYAGMNGLVGFDQDMDLGSSSLPVRCFWNVNRYVNDLG